MTGTWSPGPGATAGDDLYVGDGDNETIDGLGGNDIMVGAGGDDILISSAGADDLIGGEGYDTADFSGRTLRGMIGESGGVGFRDGGAINEGYELERIIGTQFADYLRVTNGDLNGGAGNDLLVVSNGNATGGAGNDLFWVHSTHTITDFSITDDWFMSVGGVPFASVSYSGNDTLLTSNTGHVITVQNATLTLAEANARIAGYYINTFLFTGTNVTANTGSATTDFVFGWDNALSFAALGGDDSLIGSNVNDVLNGGDGDDYLDGALGTDTASYAGASSGVTVSLSLQGSWQDTGGAGQDFLLRFENLLGSSFNDTLYGDTNANTLSGGDGNDTIYAGDDFVADTIDGGADYDIVDYSAVTDDSVVIVGSFTSGLNVYRSVYGSASGRDTIANAEEVIGSSGSDYIVAQDGIVRGGDGNDLIGSVSGGQAYGDAGTDYFYLGSGDYTIMDFELGVDRLASIDTITSITIDGADTIVTTNGGADVRVANINTLTLGEWQALLTMSGWGADPSNILSFSGTASDNFVWGGAFNDTLSGNAGDDTLVGGSGNDTLNGGDDDDRLEGGSGDDTLNGNNDNDTLDGGSGTNTLNGGAGDDYLIGGWGDDTFDGGDGIDTVSYERITTGVSVILGLTGATGAGVDSITGVENLVGSAFNDTLIGDGGDNQLSGGLGADTLNGGDGVDTLLGGDGDDVLEISSVNAGETLDGGADTDTLRFLSSNSTLNFAATTLLGFERLVIENSLAGTTNIALSTDHIGASLSADAEIVASVGTDIVTISMDSSALTLAFTFTNWSASDRILIYGTGDDDTITGSAQRDEIYGGDGADTLNGAGGNDYLFGSLGNDTINGGTGADTAAFFIDSVDADWQRNADGSWTVTSVEGVETLTNTEYLEFNDATIHLARAAQTFTGDGTSDLILRNSAGTLSAWFLNGPAISGAGMGSISADWSHQGSGDFNGDGRADILWRHDNGNVALWQMNGAAVTGFGVSSVSNDWVIESVGDFNGDTRSDIFWRNSVTGTTSIWFMNGAAFAGGGTFGNVGANWIVEDTADYNGDGRDDILWRNSGTGDVSLWFMDGLAVTGGAFGNLGAQWVAEGSGDFNGDNRADIFWRNSTTGQVALFFMNGQAVIGTASFNRDTAWDVAGIGDYNGDGRDDILWWNDNGELAAWYMNGNAFTNQNLTTLSHDWVINPGG
jgi:Ca2+-binding RTX toxin-like protein